LGGDLARSLAILVVLSSGLFWSSVRQAGAVSAVDVPAGSREFLSFPTSDSAVKLVQGWYYNKGTLYDNYCSYAGGDVSGYGRHCAIDYYKPGSNGNVTFPIVATADGVAYRASSSDGKMTIEHANADPAGRKFCTRFSHMDMSRPVIPVGKKVAVKRGQLVGWAGKTQTRTIHLHLVVRVGGCGGKPVDPYDLATGLLDRYIAPVSAYYPGGSKFTGCGRDSLWLSCRR
jgi:murein DD-endopeptidase MepM/ murein hydrolase activator NlpD